MGKRAKPAKIRRKRPVDPFVIEPMEPRILFSADLAPAAHILTGLQDAEAALDHISTTDLSSQQIPFVSRSAADLAKLGDPLAAIVSAATTYYANPAHQTLSGLVAALNLLPNANGAGTPLATLVALTAGGRGRRAQCGADADRHNRVRPRRRDADDHCAGDAPKWDRDHQGRTGAHLRRRRERGFPTRLGRHRERIGDGERRALGRSADRRHRRRGRDRDTRELCIEQLGKHAPEIGVVEETDV